MNIDLTSDVFISKQNTMKKSKKKKKAANMLEKIDSSFAISK